MEFGKQYDSKYSKLVDTALFVMLSNVYDSDRISKRRIYAQVFL